MYGLGSETTAVEQINANFSQITEFLEGENASERNVEIRLVHVWGENVRVHSPMVYLDILYLASKLQMRAGNFLFHIMVQPNAIEQWVHFLVRDSEFQSTF